MERSREVVCRKALETCVLHRNGDVQRLERLGGTGMALEPAYVQRSIPCSRRLCSDRQLEEHLTGRLRGSSSSVSVVFIHKTQEGSLTGAFLLLSLGRWGSS